MECAITGYSKTASVLQGLRVLARERTLRSLQSKVCGDCHRRNWQSVEHTSNSWEYTGDGMRLAYDAGAELMDMESYSFTPGMFGRRGSREFGDGGVREGWDTQRIKRRAFHAALRPGRWNCQPRDVVARAIYTEAKEGAALDHGGAYLDISHKPARLVKKKLPSMSPPVSRLADVD